MDETEELPVVVARVVRVLERPEDREGDVERNVERHLFAPRRSRANETCAGGAVDVLHGHVEFFVVLAEVEHLDDVRVAEASGYPRLVDEHRDEVRVLRELRKDALYGDDFLKPVGAGAARKIHLRHAPRRNAPELNSYWPEPHGRGDRRDAHRSALA